MKIITVRKENKLNCNNFYSATNNNFVSRKLRLPYVIYFNLHFFQFFLFFFWGCLFIAMAFPVGEELTQPAEPTSLYLNGDIEGSPFFLEDLDAAESRSYRRKAYKATLG